MLSQLLPQYDFAERHERVIAAPKAVVRRAAEEWQPRESVLWRVLLVGRGLGQPSGTLRQ